MLGTEFVGCSIGYLLRPLDVRICYMTAYPLRAMLRAMVPYSGDCGSQQADGSCIRQSNEVIPERPRVVAMKKVRC